MQPGRDQLIAVELQRLPLLAAPADGWQRIERRLEQQSANRSRWLSPVGTVAASVGVMGLALVWLSTLSPGTAPASANLAALDHLVERSQQLEAALQRLPARPAVERAATAAVIDELQNRILLIDAQLASNAPQASDQYQQHSMWDQRVRLLNSLVDVRYAEALRNSPPTDSATGDL